MRPNRDPEGNEAKYIRRSRQVRDKLMLELGCGDGWLTWQLVGELGEAGKVFGLDPVVADLHKGMAHKPAQAAPVWFAGAAAEHIPFPSGTFDIAFFSNSL